MEATRMSEVTKPIALVTAYGAKALDRILAEVRSGPQPPIADWYIGTYGINPVDAAKIARVPGCHYAPVFCFQPGNSMKVRKQRPMHRRRLGQAADTVHIGEIPGSSANRVIPTSEVSVWGVELGKRFRDELRAARVLEHIKVDAWQLDEILSQCVTSAVHREFVGAVLRGMTVGRPEFEDRPEKGFVWSAEKFTTALPRMTAAGDVSRFLQDLDRAASFLVGEEYPRFRGAAATVGRKSAAGHAGLVAKSGIRKALGQRYIVGMTPGWRLSTPTLGGNVDGMRLAAVTAWRNAFIDGRIATQRPRGFAQFNFVKENVRPNRLEDAIRSLNHAAKRHGA
jgi:hypothetical protein